MKIMRTVGATLREARIKRGMTRSVLAEVTKIRESFIMAIENEQWEKLPEFPVVVGFVKNLAKSLDFNEERLTALLRRDYPPKKLFVNPKPELASNFVWGPKMTSMLGVGIAILMVSTYLGYQYWNFVALPEVKIVAPFENEKLEKGIFKVKGETESNVAVMVNSQLALVEDDGKFEVEIIVDENLKEIIVVARTRAGRETKLQIPVMVESKD